MKVLAFVFILSLVFTSYSQVLDYQWGISLGSSSDDRANSIATDAQGNVYITGSFLGTVDFDPGPGTEYLTSGNCHDIFIQKLDSSGNLVWVKQIGNNNCQFSSSISLDTLNNIYIAGRFIGSLDVDPGINTNLISGFGAYDMFTLKLDSIGQFLWVYHSGNNGWEAILSQTVDNAGNVYNLGQFGGTLDFDASSSSSVLTSTNFSDIFIQKLDTDGNFLWVKQLGDSLSEERGNQIAVDSSSNIYLTGLFLGEMDFDPGINTNSLTSAAGSSDIFILKLDIHGDFLWAKAIGDTLPDRGNAITVDQQGNCYSTGHFTGVVDFDPGLGTTELIAAGSSDGYILKLDTNGNFIWVRQISGNAFEDGTSIISMNNEDIITIGTFQDSANFSLISGVSDLISNGGNDIFIAKLDSVGNFEWANSFGGLSNDLGASLAKDQYGHFYTVGNVTGNLDLDPTAGLDQKNGFGNTDVFVQKFNVCFPSYGRDTIIACNSYTWIDGRTYTESTDSIEWRLTNSLGCDSIIMLNITINHIDTSTSVNFPTILANYALASYQWFDCENNYTAIPGETNQSFTPTTNGSYAVQLTDNNCIDTSSCVQISTLNIDNEHANQVKIYPNPTSGKVIVELGQLKNVSIKIYDNTNKLIYSENNIVSPNFQFELIQATGIYIVEVISEGYSKQMKLILE